MVLTRVRRGKLEGILDARLQDARVRVRARARVGARARARTRVRVRLRLRLRDRLRLRLRVIGCCCRPGSAMQPSTLPESQRLSSARDRAGPPCRARNVRGDEAAMLGPALRATAVRVAVVRAVVRAVSPAERGDHSNGQLGRRRVEHLANEIVSIIPSEQRHREREHRGVQRGDAGAARGGVRTDGTANHRARGGGTSGAAAICKTGGTDSLQC